MNPAIFLLLNLTLAFYNVGTIWAHEIDIFCSWRLIPQDAFHRVQAVHWGKLPYWVLLPVGLGLAGSIGLVWYRPADPPDWTVWCALSSQVASLALTTTLGTMAGETQPRPARPCEPLSREDSFHPLDAYSADQRIRVHLLVWAIRSLARQ
jgi:hypothetical protein